jgi:hypothetical protein
MCPARTAETPLMPDPLMNDPNDPSVSVRRRLLLMVAGGMATVLLFACCVCGGAMFYFRPKIEQNPEKATQLTKQILREIKIPESFEPQGTIELNVFHQLQVSGAYYEMPKVDSVLALIHVDSRWNSQARVRQHIRKTLLERGGADEPLLIQESVTKKILIGSELVDFEFSTGKDLSTDKSYKLVEGLVKGTTGDVLICFKIDADYWNEKTVYDLLQSIR